MANEEGLLHYVRTTNGELIHTSHGHKGALARAKWSPVEDRIASASVDGEVKIWDAATGINLITLSCDGVRVRSLDWSPDGRRIACACEDGSLYFWGSPQIAVPETAVTLESGPLAAAQRSTDFDVGLASLADERRREMQERTAAVWVLEQMGKLVILVAGERKAVGSVDQLPTLPFQVVEIDLREQPETRDEDLARFKDLTALQNLRLKGRDITDAGLEHLGGLTALQELRFEATSVTGTGFRHLGNLHQLKTLATGYSTPISDEGLAAIPPLPNLSYFAANTGNMSDEGLRHLSRLQGLQILRLHWGKLTGEGFRHLTELPHLRELYADHGQLTDASLAHLGQIATLQKLGLDANKELSDAGLAHLHGLSNLQFLSVKETAVTEAGVQELQAKLPACKISWDGEVARAD